MFISKKMAMANIKIGDSGDNIVLFLIIIPTDSPYSLVDWVFASL